MSPPIPLTLVFEEEDPYQNKQADTPLSFRNLSLDMSLDSSLSTIRMAQTSKYIAPKREHRFEPKREILHNFLKTELAKPIFDND